MLHRKILAIMFLALLTSTSIGILHLTLVRALSVSDTMVSGWEAYPYHGDSGVVYGYSSDSYTSAPTSIMLHIWDGGMVGEDVAGVSMNKTFAWTPGFAMTRLKMNYLIAEMTDSNDGFGGMAALAEISLITHTPYGNYSYSYIVAGGTTDNGNAEANNYCQDYGPTVKYIDWYNMSIPAPGHGELEPPTGVWYTLDRNVNEDFAIAWGNVTEIEIAVDINGGYLYADSFRVFFDDLLVEGEVPSYMISIYSSPSGVQFTVNGTLETTPWVQSYGENTLLAVEMPTNCTVNGRECHFDHWSDGNTSSTRELLLNTSTVLTAYYTLQLTVTSFPDTGLSFSLNRSQETTPYSDWLLEGSYTLEMPFSYNGSYWSNWLEDGDTNRAKTVDLSNPVWTGVYTLPVYPTANFTWTPTIIMTNETLTFNATSSNSNGKTIVAYDWDFGDNETGTGQIVDHTYANAGNFTVSLNVTDDQGLSAACSNYLVVYTPYILEITSSVGGTTDPLPGLYTYAEGTEVNVTAQPSLGYIFDHWEFEESNVTLNPVTVVMNASHTLNAVFSWVGICNLTITPSTGGTTDPSPDVYNYTYGTQANVTAIADPGYGFNYWELDGNSTGSQNPITVTMDSNHTLNAVFTRVYVLTITANGGTTDPLPGEHIYFEGTEVNVTATAYTRYNFDHWELDGSWNYSDAIVVTMNESHTLTAVFNYNVTIEAYCLTESADVSLDVYMDNSSTVKTIYTFVNLTGTHTFTVQPMDLQGHPFAYWFGGGRNPTLTVSSPGTYMAVYGSVGPLPNSGGGGVGPKERAW